ncbi:hypothetical protein Asppvi_007247 [Aspergillus pseudoviridinutans]|uniref:Uncharacterized protein n=1 Tax=Aspergillus pseudoviridinutans TaxID=1517512 RepID=A0A9P3EW77_9EURO|nr:uncharacterized protein Asppvi_007247 [Aspergillus pseudoviridinutans]GIJ88327.1 hypothetical protein Asppvi_007247 [Aspergillus pseudoviridinutans]
MLPLLFIAVFLAAGVTANQVAGKFQALFFYQLYRLEVDAHGLANSRMAPGCAKAGVVCNLEEFMKEVCKIKTELPRDANGKFIKPPKGQKANLVNVPDFSKVNWGHIGEGENLNVFSDEIDSSGFKGDFINKNIFKGWGDKKDTFANVMSEAEDIGVKAIAKLNADGRQPADDRVNKMIAALKTHGDARRYDQALKITKAFEEEMTRKGFTVAYTDPIERPPVPGYRKIDADRTISDNQGNAGFNDKVEKVVKEYVSKYNSAGLSKSHVESITKTEEVHKHLAEACKA